MKMTNYNKAKKSFINILSIALFLLFSNSPAMAKEKLSISGTDLGSSRIQEKSAKSDSKASSFSGKASGSGRIKANKSKSKK